MAAAAKRRQSSRRPPPPEGATPLTFRGLTAYYTGEELAMLRELRGPDAEVFARFIHEAKVHLDATYVGPYTGEL